MEHVANILSIIWRLQSNTLIEKSALPALWVRVPPREEVFSWDLELFAHALLISWEGE